MDGVLPKNQPKMDGTTMELLQLIDKLGKEKEELAEEVRRMKLQRDGSFRIYWRGWVSEEKEKTDLNREILYETQAIIIENDEVRKKEKAELIEEMRRLHRETEGE